MKQLAKAPEDSTVENLIRRFYNIMVDEYNVALRSVNFTQNFASDIRDISIPAGSEVEVSHKLKAVPKYRIILRQSGNGVVQDGESEWTDRAIYLRNDSGNDITATVLILRS